uniref:Uncharacterized protein n=1 Tax=Arundo donax TaxID=35708 RepID=A0A0A8YPT0_ARUDO
MPRMTDCLSIYHFWWRYKARSKLYS